MPIEFNVWIDGVVRNARVIADREKLKRVWVNGEKNITSMYDFNESYEQLFDDLDATGYLDEYSKSNALTSEQQKAVREYIEHFRDFDDSKFSVDGILNVELMLDSPEWGKLESSAKKLVELF